jgi:ABC-2 type transport system ATP-binding protein
VDRYSGEIDANRAASGREQAAADIQSDPIVSIKDLSYVYGTREALAGITLDIQRRELFALLGPNGGGKTTMFRILSTLMPFTAGQVHILDYDLSQQAHEVRRHLGVVFQHPSLDIKLTVLENVCHHGRLYGLRGRKLQERAQVVLHRLGLDERHHDLVETLSGGL